MQLGIVCGTLVASRKDERLEGINLLVIQPIKDLSRAGWAEDARRASPPPMTTPSCGRNSPTRAMTI